MENILLTVSVTFRICRLFLILTFINKLVSIIQSCSKIIKNGLSLLDKLTNYSIIQKAVPFIFGYFIVLYFVVIPPSDEAKENLGNVYYINGTDMINETEADIIFDKIEEVINNITENFKIYLEEKHGFLPFDIREFMYNSIQCTRYFIKTHLCLIKFLYKSMKWHVIRIAARSMDFKINMINFIECFIFIFGRIIEAFYIITNIILQDIDGLLNLHNIKFSEEVLESTNTIFKTSMNYFQKAVNDTIHVKPV